MKRIFYLIVFFGLSFILFHDSCKTKEAFQPSPVITRVFPVEDSIYVDSNTVVKFKFEANASAADCVLNWFNIKLFKITTKETEVTSFKLLSNKTKIGAINPAAKSFVFEDSLLTGSVVENGTRFLLRFWSKDKAGMANSNYFIFIIKKSSPTYFTKEETGIIYNKSGTLSVNPAWDLSLNISKYAADAPGGIDMINYNNLNMTPDTNQTFRHGWRSLNSTTFLKVNSTYDYDKAPFEEAVKVYTNASSGSKKSVIDTAYFGDIYVVKLRGTENYLLLKVTEIMDDNLIYDKDSLTYNNDYIKFTYKKK